MEVIAIGGLAFVAYKLGTKSHAVDQPPVHSDVMANTDQVFLYDAKVNGAWAPASGIEITRRPYNQGSLAPYFMFQPGRSHMQQPVSDYVTQINNTMAHRKADFEEGMRYTYPQWFAKSNQPVYLGYTPEMRTWGPEGEVRQTNQLQYSWLPARLTDTDVNDAVGLLAKAAPRDPSLFMPANDFITAPGLDFRYSTQ